MHHPDIVLKNKDPQIYEDLLKHGDYKDRQELAEEGYFLEQLVNDSHPQVSIAAIKRDPSYLKYRKRSNLTTDEWNVLYDKLIPTLMF